jgi:hypothetical protein
MGPQVEGADTALRGTGSERAPGHLRLGVPSNLPAELSTFVGRADDLERGAWLLGESRLVTFTGAGGCGKTRLARQVAARVAERFPGGVWWVELASLADGALVTERVARTLGLQTGETAAVADYFAGSTALLLLDNCEHIACRRVHHRGPAGRGPDPRARHQPASPRHGRGDDLAGTVTGGPTAGR